MGTMDWAGLVDAVEKTAAAVLPLVSPDASKRFDAAVAAANRTIELVDHVKQMVTGTADVAELQRTRDALEAAVNKHVDATVGRLRGEQ